MMPKQCPLCSVPRPHNIGTTHRNQETVYTLYACPTCKAEFWWPLKNPGSHWYEHDVRYADRNEDPIREPNWNHKKVISFLKPLTGRVLDAGCGVGNILVCASKNGWRGTGIDFDHDAVEAGSIMFGLTDLQMSDLGTYVRNHAGEKFDLITFFDVLEHLDHNQIFF